MVTGPPARGGKKRETDCACLCTAGKGEQTRCWRDTHLGVGMEADTVYTLRDLNFSYGARITCFLAFFEGVKKTSEALVDFLKNKENQGPQTLPQLCTWVMGTQVFHCNLYHVRQILF